MIPVRVLVVGEPARRPAIAPDAQLADQGLLALALGGDRTSFTGDLLRLIAKADPGNRARLAMAFPRTVSAWEIWLPLSPAITCAQLLAALDDPAEEPPTVILQPVDGEELLAHAARRFAHELERLQAGLAERGIVPALDCPVDTAAVDTALRALGEAAPIVRAAIAWRAQFEKPADSGLPRMAALIEAVDALIEAVDALPHIGEPEPAGQPQPGQPAKRGAFDLARDALLARYGTTDPARLRELGADAVEIGAAEKMVQRIPPASTTLAAGGMVNLGPPRRLSPETRARLGITTEPAVAGETDGAGR